MSIRPAVSSDATGIAELHAASWRRAYRGILRDEFLDGPVVQERRRLWESRLSQSLLPEARFVALIENGGELEAFVCVLLDADAHWGALLDNLHVSTSAQGRGLGRSLMAEAARWVLQRRPHSRLHLWVYEKNVAACGFYEHLGGVITEHRAKAAPDGCQIPAIRYGWEDLAGLTCGGP